MGTELQPVNVTPVTRKEQLRLLTLESAVQEGLSNFVRVGTALCEIRDSRLYRATHDNFEAYCKDRFGFGRSYASRVIRAAATAEALRECVPAGQLPYRHARALLGLPPDAQRAAYDAASEGGVPTSEQLEEVAACARALIHKADDLAKLPAKVQRAVVQQEQDEAHGSDLARRRKKLAALLRRGLELGAEKVAGLAVLPPKQRGYVEMALADLEAMRG